jgi:hypothetical protein
LRYRIVGDLRVPTTSYRLFNEVYKHEAQLAKVSNDTEPPLEIPHRLPKEPAPSLAAGKYPIQESSLKRVA